MWVEERERERDTAVAEGEWIGTFCTWAGKLGNSKMRIKWLSSGDIQVFLIAATPQGIRD